MQCEVNATNNAVAVVVAAAAAAVLDSVLC